MLLAGREAADGTPITVENALEFTKWQLANKRNRYGPIAPWADDASERDAFTALKIQQATSELQGSVGFAPQMKAFDLKMNRKQISMHLAAKSTQSSSRTWRTM